MTPHKAEQIFGAIGNDTVGGGGGIDTLFGGDGADSLSGGPGNDQIFGNDDNDRIVWNAGDGNDTIEGGLGIDLLEINGGGSDEIINITDDGEGRVNVGIQNGVAELLDVDGVEDVEINGGNGNDSLILGDLTATAIDPDTVTFNGGAGNDSLDGAALQFNAIIADGGAGNDTLIGGGVDDSLTGNADDDTLQGGGGDDMLDGGVGQDTAVFAGDSGDFTINDLGGGVFDVIDNNVIDDDLGTDNLTDIEFAQFDDQTVDLAALGSGATAGDDLLDGTAGNDTIDGLAGNDTINGLGGDDSLIGNADLDVLIGGPGNDEIFGGAGNDRIIWNSGDGNDTIRGGIGTDVLEINGGAGLVNVSFEDDSIALLNVDDVEDVEVNGGNGNDSLTLGNLEFTDIDPETIFFNGEAGNDSLDGSEILFSSIIADGGADDDSLIRGRIGDTLQGGTGNDILEGGNGSDSLIGGDPDDTTPGGADDDTIDGGLGNDTLLGGEGDDRLDGGEGDDMLDGGDGQDTAVFAGNSADFTVNDLSGGAFDVIDNNAGDGDLGTDNLVNVEFAQFDDQTINLMAGAPAGVVELSDIAAGNGGFVINGIDASDYSGRSVSGAGDVNGDGFADLVVGAYQGDPGGANEAGESYVVFGKIGGAVVELSDVTAGTGGFVINGADMNDFSGRSVSGAGDVNGDGMADVIIGAPTDTIFSNGAGKSYLVFGKADGMAVELTDLDGPAGTGGFVVTGIDGSDYSGISVSDAGDVNGDGLADLIIGAYRANGVAGESYVVFGRTDTNAIDLADVAAGTGGFVLNGIDGMDYSGQTVSGAGDVNGDGRDDVIIGAPAGDPNGPNSGEGYVVFGKDDGTAVHLADIVLGTGGFVLIGVAGNDQAGFSVSGAGDVNGDGLADVIIGARLAAPGGMPSAGTSYLVFGKANTLAV